MGLRNRFYWWSRVSESTRYNIRKYANSHYLQRFLFVFLLTLGVLIGVGVYFMYRTFSDMKALSKLESYANYSVPTKVYDINGELITEFFYEKRELVTFDQLPEYLVEAIVATEDNYFYRHHGINLVATFKGVVIDPLLGRGVRGGSGLTQQLAKQLFTDSKRTIWRKLVELWYALQIEKKYSKNEILELYFNLIYFGHGTYGIQSASHYYFNKDVSQLDLGEASFLAGLPQAPSRYSPIRNAQASMNRHKVVLQSMANSGYISQETVDETWTQFWEDYDRSFNIQTLNANRAINKAPFFTEYVRQFLLERYTEEQLYTEGLSIYTTLDLQKQRVAERELDKAINAEQDRYDRIYDSAVRRIKNKYIDTADFLSLALGLDGIPIGESKVKNTLDAVVQKNQDAIYLSSILLGMNHVNQAILPRYKLKALVSERQGLLEGAVISIKPQTGYIEVMVGGKEFSYANQFNRAIQSQRMMGSLFKPIYYALALDNKIITPATVFVDEPKRYVDNSGNEWYPRNYSGTFSGPTRVRVALRRSVNLVAIQIWNQVLRRLGYAEVMEQMSGFFNLTPDDMKERVQANLSYALGVGSFSPLEVATAFGVFPNEGKEVLPIGVLRVKDRQGQILDDFELNFNMRQNPRQVISPQTAFLMENLLSDVLRFGTGYTSSTRAGYTYRDSGGKTGTTPNWTDAWFAGFTKNLVSVVWVGFDDQNRSIGKGRSAAVVAAPVWMQYMKRIHRNIPPVPFPRPSGVVSARISSETGLLPLSGEDSVMEYFLSGTVPKKTSPTTILVQKTQQAYVGTGVVLDLQASNEAAQNVDNNQTEAPTVPSDLDLNLEIGN